MNAKTMLSIPAFCMSVTTDTAAQSGAANRKPLVAYFSWGGNTRGVAEQVHARAGGDLFEITPVKPYSTDYDTCIDETKREQAQDARPLLKSHVANIAQYDVIFLGYPNWWSSIPMPVASFLEEYDFAGKTIIPFFCHGGGRFGQSLSAIAKLAPRSTIKEGLSVKDDKSLLNDIAAWLLKNGVAAQ
jgi:flavodoxin